MIALVRSVDPSLTMVHFNGSTVCASTDCIACSMNSSSFRAGVTTTYVGKVSILFGRRDAGGYSRGFVFARRFGEQCGQGEEHPRLSPAHIRSPDRTGAENPIIEESPS